MSTHLSKTTYKDIIKDEYHNYSNLLQAGCLAAVGNN
jgi:hypothetical protein